MLDCFHAKKSERETESKGERKERKRERERERKKERNKVRKKRIQVSQTGEFLYYIFLPNSDLCFPSPALTKGS